MLANQWYIVAREVTHMFRFLKQNMGLNSSRSNNLVATEQWMWMCALAYWQLLLMRDLVEEARPAWHPRFRDGQSKPLTPGQVQRAALRYLLQLGTPAKVPKLAGKGKGRSKGYCPAPRKRYPVVSKAKNGQNRVSASP